VSVGFEEEKGHDNLCAGIPDSFRKGMKILPVFKEHQGASVLTNRLLQGRFLFSRCYKKRQERLYNRYDQKNYNDKV
jgi:hypothetical protein